MAAAPASINANSGKGVGLKPRELVFQPEGPFSSGDPTDEVSITLSGDGGTTLREKYNGKTLPPLVGRRGGPETEPR